MSAIPVIDISPLLRGGQAGAPAARQIAECARGIGFMVVTGLDADIRLEGEMAQRMLALFKAPEAEKRRLSRKKFAPENPLIYRGFFPVQPGQPGAFKEGIDIGVHAHRWPPSADPLREVVVLPDESLVPGFGEAMQAWAAVMEALGAALLRVLADAAGLDAEFYAREFHHGASTLRLLHYPVRPPESYAGLEARATREHHGERRAVGTGEHTDSGGLTLLVQDSVGGLQVLGMDGVSWHDVPPAAGSVIVNLGDLMELWSGGRYRATPHRVLGGSRERFSIPFFFEPRYDALIITPDGQRFTYRDHLVKKMAGFTEFKGLAV